VPVAVLGTDAFLLLARAAAATHGMPHLSVAAVPHPIGGLDPAAVRAKAEPVVDRVVAALTRDPEPPDTAAVAATAVTAAPDDLEGFQAFALAEGWADGLPVVPPTPERVGRMLGRHAPNRATLVAALAPTLGLATLEAIAVNAVLAGAGPEHLPVIVAAVRAVADPAFNLSAVQTTTHPCTPLVIVNGPIARELGINAGPNALGQGHRANAVIGRALRLTLQNVGGARPGETDRATLGHPGKYAYCLAENEAASPWDSLAVERGFRADESCVTVAGSDAPTNVNDHGSTTAEALLLAFAGTAASTGSNNVYLGGEPLLIVGPEHARTFAGSGWSKRDLKVRLWERARVRLDRLSPENLARFAQIDPERFADRPPGADVAIARRAEDVMVIVAGGPGKHSAIVPTFGATRAVTVRVE
jgi:hypothetical protein